MISIDDLLEPLAEIQAWLLAYHRSETRIYDALIEAQLRAHEKAREFVRTEYERCWLL